MTLPEVIDEMYAMVRYFEMLGIQFEPPDETTFEPTPQDIDNLVRLGLWERFPRRS